ncbi:MAG TPA: hypothetical protein VHK69_02095, partial [Chitinophagaceae bacterium]|nr:hypothetical protein [Chitinophagaceae bacterium]
MHKYPGVLFLFLIIGLHGSAQKKEAPPGVPKKIRGVDENCQYRPRYSAAQRRNFYPFKGSDSIVLVSFRHHWKNYPVRADSV